MKTHHSLQPRGDFNCLCLPRKLGAKGLKFKQVVEEIRVMNDDIKQCKKKLLVEGIR